MTFVTVILCLLSLALAALISHLSVIKACPAMGVKIKKKILFSLQIPCTWKGELEIRQLLPNKFAQAIGPFILFDHIRSLTQMMADSHPTPATNRSQVCRGIAVLTYILNAEVEHIDSIGHHETLGTGGIHWTKSGNGIVYDEIIRPEAPDTNSNVSIVRLWTNLPSKNKAEKPIYIKLKSSQIPKEKLDDDAGWVRIVLGVYKDNVSKISHYCNEFLYHVQLEAGKQFLTIAGEAIAYAAFLPANKAVINGTLFQAGDLIVFETMGGIIEIKNRDKSMVDIILFGGDPYKESVVTDENFVMNNPHEISQAYNDYYEGKYGQIKRGNKNNGLK